MSSGVRCEYIWMQPVSDLGFAPVTVDFEGGGEFPVLQCGRPRLMDPGGQGLVVQLPGSVQEVLGPGCGLAAQLETALDQRVRFGRKVAGLDQPRDQAPAFRLGGAENAAPGA